MSWEELHTERMACPCGKGIITQKHYGDDWNRFREGPVIIECEECNNNYLIEEEYHQGRLPSDGYWTDYYITPKNYPKYNGISEYKVYGEKAWVYKNFAEWLVENYTFEELKDVENQLQNTKSSENLFGTARKIRDIHKKEFKTVRVSTILKAVRNAVEIYPTYRGNKKERDEIRKKENIEYRKYIEEKRKHQIKFESRI